MNNFSNDEIKAIKEALKKIEDKARFAKPNNYIFLKEHIKNEIDKEIIIECNLAYQLILSDEIILKIANCDDLKLTSKIYNLIVTEKYKSKLYNSFPKKHPVRISSKILAITTLLFGIIGLIIGTVLYENFYVILLAVFLGLIIGFCIGVIIEKIYTLI